MFIGNSPKKWIRICPSLNWTINERLTNEELPSFNDCPDVDEDNTDQTVQEITCCGCITSGLIMERMARYWSLAERFCQLDTGTLWQRLHIPEMGAPPVSHNTRINYLWHYRLIARPQSYKWGQSGWVEIIIKKPSISFSWNLFEVKHLFEPNATKSYRPLLEGWELICLTSNFNVTKSSMYSGGEDCVMWVTSF